MPSLLKPTPVLGMATRAKSCTFKQTHAGMHVCVIVCDSSMFSASALMSRYDKICVDDNDNNNNNRTDNFTPCSNVCVHGAWCVFVRV